MTAFVAGQRLTAAALNAIVTPAEWTPYTPTWTNLTVGNGSQAFRYWRGGNGIMLHARIVLGSTSTVGTSPVFTLPVAAQADNYGGGAVATFRDVSASADYDGFLRLAGTTQAWFELKNSAGANDGRTLLTATTPFTWATGDIMDGFLFYEAA